MKFWKDNITFIEGEFACFSNAIYVSLEDDNLNHLPNATIGENETQYWELYLDPITQVYNALWALLETHTPFTQLVALKNRIKYTGINRDPEKEQVLTEDLPEVRIVPTDTTPHLQATSSTTKILKKFRIEVASGDQRVDAGLFAIEWEIYRALLGWQTTLMALKWNDKAYVVNCRPSTVKDGLMRQSDIERGVRSWVSIWECEVEMYFTTADMKVQTE